MLETSWKVRKAQDWKNYVPPARPSSSDLAEIERFLMTQGTPGPGTAVAILGCTVEYRELAHKLGFRVFLYEGSADHYDILTQERVRFPGDHELVLTDWRSMRAQREFDFVLGDNVLNMLDDTGRDIVLENVASSLLRPGGRFIARTYVEVPGMPRTWDEILDLRADRFSGVNLFLATQHLVFVAYRDEATGFTNVTRALADMEKSWQRGRLSDEEYEFIRKRFERDPVGVCVPTEASLDHTVSRRFVIEAKVRGLDVYSEYMPIYILRTAA